MYVRKTAEIQHNTDDQVKQYAAAAVAIADELALSDSDRATLLPTIMAQVASKQVFLEQQQVGALGIVQPNGMRGA